MKKDQNFSGVLPQSPTKALPWTRCGAYSTSRHPSAFYNIQKLNLCSKRDISKTAWTNACIEINNSCYHLNDMGCSDI